MYVTDGETNASLGKGDRLEAMPPERAYELLAVRREAIVEKGGPAAQEGCKATAKKAAPAKKAAARQEAPEVAEVAGRRRNGTSASGGAGSRPSLACGG